MSDERVLRDYLGQIEQAYRQGNATEHTYRPMLKTALETLVPQLHITATNEPKRVACGAPDYLITRADPSGALAAGLTIGYVEAKDLGMSLDEVERSDQLRRYRASLENLVLTNYSEFRWYLQGQPHGVARLATLDTSTHRLTLNARGLPDTLALLDGFLTRSPAPINNPKELAERMARLTHIIRDLTVGLFGPDTALSQTLSSADLHQLQDARDTLEELRAAFAETLIPGLPAAEFADMFAQTLAYGLFAARYNHTGAAPFTRQMAARDIPRTNPFLRRLFEAVTGVRLDDAPFTPFVDNLAQLLNATDMEAVLRDFGKRTRTDDPMIHFYETFLREYDPKLRELRGVYYTPAPVVSYIVRSVDSALRSEFACPDGLASDTASGGAPVTLLDPACGTGTFLYATINHIRERFMARNAAGDWSEYVGQRLLKRLFGFELLMAPYAMAHLKLGMQLSALDLPEADRARWAWRNPGDERLGVYLTNTLEEAAKRTERLIGGEFISAEANAAAGIKRDAPVLVVLGNPPYSGHSANKGEWITALLHGEERKLGQTGGKGLPTGDYFSVDGQPLGERNPKWLNDDYVKFIRFAQWRIERTGHGVLAFITNHGYLDNPTFRGMRQSLMQTFDDIYLLDLHGNSKKKERDPDPERGGRDENVFDIQQGVAIGIFIRRRGESAPRSARIHHAHLYGERQRKYDWLETHDLTDTAWTDVQPQSPFYLFIPQDRALAEEYEAGWRITDVMAVNVLGFQTHRDAFAIDFDERALRQRIAEMRDTYTPDQQFATKYDLQDSDSWQLAKARQTLRKDAKWESHFVRCLYRPFDWRPCYFDEVAMDRPRRELRQHMLKPNLSLNVTRQTREIEWRHALVANAPTPALYTEIKDGSNAFPLYLYPTGDVWDDLMQSDAPGGRRANLAPAFIAALTERLGMAWVADGKGDRVATVGPEDVFSYLYAVFSAPGYRARYAAFLKSDFPRLPLTGDTDLFRALCALGDELIRLHLLEDASSDPSTGLLNRRSIPSAISYPIPGDNRAEAVRYTEPGTVNDGGDQGQGRVWINATQYLAGVAPEVWAFSVGGYQPCQKWLKDRKGRALSLADREHYGRMVTALGETIRLMGECDDAIEAHGGWPLG